MCGVLSLAYIVELAAHHKVESEGYGHKQSYRYKGNNRRVDRESHEDKQHKEALAKDCGDRFKYARDKYQAHNIHIAVKHGGVALLNAIPAVKALLDSTEDADEKTGIKIVLKALEEPVRQIAANAGLEGSVIVENIIREGKVGYGFDALNEVYTDMIPAGIVDPTKVTRSALQNAASVASMVLTTESLVADIKEAAPVAAAPDIGGMY